MEQLVSLLQGAAPLVLPCLVTVWLLFMEWTFCYELCWVRLPRGSAIVLIVLYNVLIILLVGMRLWIYIATPGYLQVATPAYDLDDAYQKGRRYLGLDSRESVICEKLIPPPPVFVCSSTGLPEYCHECHSLKLLRSHHSAQSRRCIVCMDHYCGFIGAVIGQGNYLPFMLFLIVIEALFLLTVIALFGSIMQWKDKLYWPIVLTIAINTLSLGLLTNLTIADLMLASRNESTLERLAADKEKGRRWRKADTSKFKRYLNIKHPTLDIRVIVPLQIVDHPYSLHSARENFYERFRRDYVTCTDVQQLLAWDAQQVPESFREVLYKRISQGEFTVFGFFKLID